MGRAVMLVVAVGLVGGGCGSGSSSPEASSMPSNSALDGPVMRHPTTSDNTDGQGAEVRGVLELDGDCLYLAVDEIDERFPVVWPAGTSWSGEEQLVVLPTGEEFELGDALAGGGGYSYAPDLEWLVGPEAAALGRRCADDNAFGEVAVVNNFAGAIAPA